MTCRLATALRHKEGLHKYMGTAWIIASGKGGVGKSTLSACLGMEIARNGQRVCIVDADIGLRDQDVLLGVQDCIVYDILDVANGICPVDDALVVPKPDALPNLSLLPASQFARAKELEAKAFRKILRTLKSNFDHVLIDAPAGIERSLRGLLSNEINECVLVCTPDDVCIRNAERTASVLRKKGLTAQRVIVNRLNPDYIRRGEMYAAQTVALTLDIAAAWRNSGGCGNLPCAAASSERDGGRKRGAQCHCPHRPAHDDGRGRATAGIRAEAYTLPASVPAPQKRR